MRMELFFQAVDIFDRSGVLSTLKEEEIDYAVITALIIASTVEEDTSKYVPLDIPNLHDRWLPKTDRKPFISSQKKIMINMLKSVDYRLNNADYFQGLLAMFIDPNEFESKRTLLLQEFIMAVFCITMLASSSYQFTYSKRLLCCTIVAREKLLLKELVKCIYFV
jgi:hypothetical protein